MKKTLLLVLVLFMTGSLFAQTRVGIRGGPNFSSITSRVNGTKTTSKIITSLEAGLTADVRLADEFYLQPGLLFEGKGGISKNSDTKTVVSYLQVPVDFLYKPVLGKGNFVIAFGPYFAFAVAGKYKSGSTTVDAFSNDAGSARLKHFDAGANFQTGYEWHNGLFLVMHTDLGLTNILANPNGNSIKNTSFGVSVGYQFGSW